MVKKKLPHFEFKKEYKLIHNGKDAVIDSLPDNEFCVSCSRFTDVPKNLHIDLREHYVEGAGQLCKECYEKIYK